MKMRKWEKVVSVLILVFLLAAMIFACCSLCKSFYYIGWNKGYEDANALLEVSTKADQSSVKIQEEAERVEQIQLIELESCTVADAIEEAEPEVIEPVSEPYNFEDDTPETITPDYTDDDLFCLAAVIYQEAGADYMTDDLRRMVADVVLNRVADERYPDSIREVLQDAPNGAMQYGMFSVTGVCFPAYVDDRAEQRAYRIAEEVLCGNHSELYGNGYICQAEFVQGTEGFWKEGIYFAKG